MMSKYIKRLNINNQMLVFILGTTLVIFILSIGYISLNTRKTTFQQTTELIKTICQNSAKEAEDELNKSAHIIRTLAQTFSTYHTMPRTQWQNLVINMYRNVFENNPQFYKLWDSWELRMIDSTYTKDYGRFVITFYRENKTIKYSTTFRSMDGDPPLYSKIKREATESIWEPYWDVFLEGSQDQKFMTSISVPILKNGQYVGIVAADITMDKLQEIVGRINPFADSYAYLLSNQGVFIAHPHKEVIGKKISEFVPKYDSEHQLTQKIISGTNFDFIAIDPLTNKETLVVFNRINVGKTKTPWSIGIAIPMASIMKKANRSFQVSIIVTLLGLLILTILIYRISRSISRPLVLTTETIKQLSLGDLAAIEKLKINRQDEIGQMAESLNRLIEGLERTAKFARQIGEGNLDVEYQLLSKNDVLGNALLEMQKSLQKAKEEEMKRKIEDEKQRWITEGLAKFSEILRNNNNDLKKLSFELMSNLVNYVNANQGALFVYYDDKGEEPHLEMTTAIAYNRQKYMKKKITIGEDLVGRCAYERKTIYLLEIPENYIEITSGMGTANPRCLILVPVLLNDQIFGVMELASFHKFEPYQIDFLEKIGESVASTISNVRINEKTQRLLLQSQQQREELAAQEEEMRQNLEELQATQEESARKEYEMRGLIQALSASTYTVEYDLNGRIVAVNDAVAQLFGLSKEQIIGTYHKDGTDFRNRDPEEYEEFWEDLRNGIPRKELTHIIYNGRDVYLSETYTPILDEDGTPYKVLKIGFDVTDLHKKQERISELEKKIQELEQHIAELNQRPSAQNQTKNSESLDADSEESLPGFDTSSTLTLSSLANENNQLIEKSPDLLTSLNEIDEQHNRIIELANHLFGAFLEEKSKKEIKEILKNLIDYTSYHFSTEERYFKQFGYENIEFHTKEHRLFTETAHKFQQAYASGKYNAPEFFYFVRQWILNHFGESDQDFVQLFVENGF